MRRSDAAFGRALLHRCGGGTSVLVLTLLTSCAAFQPVLETDPPAEREELRTYESNLIHWNVLSVQHDTMEPIPPLPSTHTGKIASQAEALNQLFAIGFDIASSGSDGNTIGAGNDLPDPAAARRRLEGRIVTIYVGAANGAHDGDGDPPHVRGIALNETGWVLTVRHPFENRPCSAEESYLRFPGSETRYPIVSCRSGSGQNVMLARFDFDGRAVGASSPLRFSLPRRGETGFLPLGQEPGGEVSSIEITETGIPLQLGSDLVYEENFIGDTPESIDQAVSGTPAWNRFGEIIGLYYHRSADGDTVGFAALSDLPRQVGEAVRAVHREAHRAQ